MPQVKRKRGLLANRPIKPPCHLIIKLSDELLLMISKAVLANGDLGQFRLTCKKIRDITENDMFQDLIVSLSEDTHDWTSKLQNVPELVSNARTLTILNQCQKSDGSFFTHTIPRKGSARLGRWGILYRHADRVCTKLDSSVLMPTNWTLQSAHISPNQLTTFRWRHGVPMPFEHFSKLLLNSGKSLQEIEISMVRPPAFSEVQALDASLATSPLTNLKSISYLGLSHTEPLRVNNPEQGGRFRMLRPILRQTYGQLKELCLLQDHCVSQVGKAPIDTNGRTFVDTLCQLEEMIWKGDDPKDNLPSSITLSLHKLELGGFQLASLAADTSRIQLDLSRLQYLTLNNCAGLYEFFEYLQSRSKDLHLRSFAIRYATIDDNPYVTAESMRHFLLSFKGLEALSVLWSDEDGMDQISHQLSEIFNHHFETLEVYTVDVTAHVGPFRFNVRPEMDVSTWTPDCIDDSGEPRHSKLRELSFNLTNKIELASEVSVLRLLSQHRNLRTVHIRNFPEIQNLHPEAESIFWRTKFDETHPEVIPTVRNFAELIALPCYTVDMDHVFGDPLLKKTLSMAEFHVKVRNEQLFGQSDISDLDLQEAPIAMDRTTWILEKRAELDPDFDIRDLVMADAVTDSEKEQYEKTVQQVRVALGHDKPTIADRPKLRLLIVGDWRYRDLMNTTGPRTWNPAAWCKRDVNSESNKANDEDDMEVDEDEDDEYGDWYRTKTFTFLENFEKEWDSRLRPVFFKIDWKSCKGPDGKYKWKAEAELLPHTTLEGQKPLYDVRSLKHAWE